MANDTLSIKLRLAISDFLRDSKRAGREYQSDVTKMAGVSKTQGKKISAALAGGVQSKQAKADLKKTETGFKKLSKTARNDGKQVQTALAQGVDAGAAKRDLKNLETQFTRVRNVGTKTPAELAAAQRRLVNQQQKTNRATQSWVSRMGDAKVKMLAIIGATGGLILALRNSSNTYRDFEKNIAEVNTLLNLNDSGINALADDVRRLSVATGTDAQNNAKALYNIVSAGATEAADANFVLGQATKAAIAGVTDTNTATKGVLAVINAYGLEIADATRVSDILFATVRGGVTTFPELSQSLGNVLTVAKGAGVPLEALTAIIAQLTKAGLSTPVAVTATRGAIAALTSPAKEAKDAMAEYGIEVGDFITTIRQIAQLNPDPELLRRLVPDIEASVGVRALIGNIDGLTTSIKAMHDSAGATETAYNIITATDSHKVDLMKAAFNELAIGLGAFISDGVNPSVEALTKLFVALDQMPFAAQTMLKAFVGAGLLMAIAASGIGVAITAAVTAIGTLLTAAGPFVAFFAATAGIVATGTYAWLAHIDALAEMKTAQNEAIQSEAKRASSLKRLEIINRKNAQVEKLSAEALAGLTDKERAAYGDRLQLASNYWRDLFALQVANGLDENSGLLKQTRQQARSYSQRLSAYQTYVQQRQQQTAELAQQLTKHKQAHDALTESIKADLDELIEANKKRTTELARELEKGVQAEQAANDKIKQLRSELAGIEQSTADKVRALRRRDLSDTEKQADLQAQSVEKINAARRALRKGDTGGANALAGQAQALASQIDATDRAVRITEAAGKLLEKSKKKEIVATRAAAAEHKKANIGLRAEIEKSKAELVSMQQTLEKIGGADIAPEVSIKGIDKALKDLDALSKKIDQVNRKQANINSGVQTRRHGGPVFANTGKQLPGYGGGDKVPVMAEAGEWIINKERSRRFGSLLNAINFGSLDSVQAMISQFAFTPKFEIGGIVPGAVPTAAPALAGAGGGGGPTGDTVNLSIDLGGPRRFDLFGQRDQVNDFVAALENVSRG